ncbi:hypothetical protein [Silvibacterium sp.]|uniref:hypothetical protein n=1 Tax=Silvibacterium sp. TaxID=1964179 RepID=UPI0039E45004
MTASRPEAIRRAVLTAMCLFLLFWFGYFVDKTWHWALVNDAPQLSYLIFLMKHGMKPYRDIIEMNMPGTYLVHFAVLGTLGWSALAWRIFDVLLMLGIGGAMVAIAWPYSRASGIFSAVLFALFHGRDGMGETGERDLVIAALLLVSYAAVFSVLRRGRAWPMFFAGLCAGYAATIKPIPLPMALLLVVVGALAFRREQKPLWKPLVAGLTGMAVAFAIVGEFLVHEGVLGLFLREEHEMLPFYAHLGDFDLHWMLQNCSTSSFLTLSVLALVLTLALRAWQSWEDRLLLTGIAFGVFSYFYQQKGTPYHRYPMIAFTLLWCGIIFFRAMRRQGFVRWLAVVAVGYGVVLAPLYAHTAAKRPWSEDYEHGLTADLQALGGAGLSGHVQCLATSAECDTVLYRMQLVQATGLAYDYFVFNRRPSPVVTESQQRFWAQMEQNPPKVMVVTVGLYPSDRFSYDKLALWPQFQAYLGEHYRLYAEREFPMFEQRSIGYRLYVRTN